MHVRKYGIFLNVKNDLLNMRNNSIFPRIDEFVHIKEIN